MKDDLISRQAAINAIENTECELSPEEWEELTDAIKAVPPTPSVQPEKVFVAEVKVSGEELQKCVDRAVERFKEEGQTDRWIPVSERLPENGHYYLWCSDMGSVQSDYYRDGFEKGMRYGYNIIAWMPLPEPYKAEREEV